MARLPENPPLSGFLPLVVSMCTEKDPLPDSKTASRARGWEYSDGMSRGPTRRVRQLIESGAVDRELLLAAEQEADLAACPYTGLEHIEVALLRAQGRDEEADRNRSRAPAPGPHHWWRPLGPRSAFRPRGLAETAAAQRAAQRNEQILRPDEPNDGDWQTGHQVPGEGRDSSAVEEGCQHSTTHSTSESPREKFH